MSAVLYGIDTCDQCRKARQWLAACPLPTRFHDLRRDGFDAALLQGWLTQVDGEALLNRRSLTWRRLDEAQRQSVADPARLAALLLAEPLLIKRPVLTVGDQLLIGFSEAAYAACLAQATPS